MYKIVGLAMIAAMILSGCIPAAMNAMNSFQSGYTGYQPPDYQAANLQVAPIPQRPSMTQGTIYTPRGPVHFNATTY